MSLKDMASDKEENKKLANELRAELRKVTSKAERFEGEKNEYLDELHEKQGTQAQEEEE